ncbi:glycine--tRNA ligase subunit beta, partial [Klebsiella pneumoniae]
VVRPRLADAQFFFESDKKKTLESRLESLDSVLFQKQLGTLKDKSARISELAGYIAQQLGADKELAQRAGLLSKTDLMTEMVMEFTDIQGVMGMH